MNFSDTQKVSSVISVMKTAEVTRASQRSLLNDFFNGKPLWDADEAKENRITINFNDKSGSCLLHTARAQYENALMGNPTYCRVKLANCPSDKSSDWESFITNKLNYAIARSKDFYHIQDEVFGSVVLHGSGAKIWWDQFDWCPSFVGPQDLLIPTDTTLTMRNLQYFAVKRKMRPGELFRKTLGAGDCCDKGWNLTIVKRLLDTYKELNQNPHNYDWTNNPEQMGELVKQNQSFYDSDAAPVIWFWDFYHREECEGATKNGWYKKILLDNDSVTSSDAESNVANEFVYQSTVPVAEKLEHIIHFQFGDGNNVPPFTYHGMRSLAFQTYELLWTMNRLRCQWTQHVFEQMLTIYRVTDPTDRSRLQQIVMESPWGIMPEGLNMVTAQERYSVDKGLVDGLRAEYAQLVSQSSTSYTQSPDNGTQKERTAYEVQAMLSNASALMGSMLKRAYKQEIYAAQEICRRYTMKNPMDFDIKKFQSACKAYGIPERWIDHEEWEIDIDQKLGGGNRMMEVAEANQLMEKIHMFDPSGQTEIKHRWVSAISDSYSIAKRLSPLDGAPKVTASKHDAELSYGAMMQGVPVSFKEGTNRIETVDTMLQLMIATVKRIQQEGGVGKMNEMIGLNLANSYVEQNIAHIEQDTNEKDRVKQYRDALGQVMNQVKAFTQRMHEQMQAQQPAPGDDGTAAKTAASVKGKIIESTSKAKISEAQAKQKLAHKEQAFRQKQQIELQKTKDKIELDKAKAVADAHTAAIVAGAEAEAKAAAETSE